MTPLAKKSQRTPRGEASSTPDPNVQLADIGVIVGAFGLEGHVKVQPLTDFPDRFDVGNVVLLGDNPVEIRACAWHKNQARLKLAGVDSIEQAEALHGCKLQIPLERRGALRRDEFYDTDLIGMQVFDQSGHLIGLVDGIVHAPAQDLLQVSECLIPMVREFVKRVSLKDRRITVSLIPGMGPGEETEEVR